MWKPFFLAAVLALMLTAFAESEDVNSDKEAAIRSKRSAQSEQESQKYWPGYGWPHPLLGGTPAQGAEFSCWLSCLVVAGIGMLILRAHGDN